MDKEFINIIAKQKELWLYYDSDAETWSNVGSFNFGLCISQIFITPEDIDGFCKSMEENDFKVVKEDDNVIKFIKNMNLIVEDKEICSGSPTLKGSRLRISLLKKFYDMYGENEFIEEWGSQLSKLNNNIKDIIDLLKNE